MKPEQIIEVLKRHQQANMLTAMNLGRITENEEVDKALSEAISLISKVKELEERLRQCCMEVKDVIRENKFLSQKTLSVKEIEQIIYPYLVLIYKDEKDVDCIKTIKTLNKVTEALAFELSGRVGRKIDEEEKEIILDAVGIAKLMIKGYDKQGGGYSQKEALKVLIETATALTEGDK